MRYQCLALAQSDLSDRTAHYTQDELFSLAAKFINFVENGPVQEQQQEEPQLSPAEYIEKYISIVHPARGKIPFKLYSYQWNALSIFDAYDITLVNGARQMGMSRLTDAYLLHRALTSPFQTLAVIAPRNRDAKDHHEELKAMYQRLDCTTKPMLTSYTSNSLEFENGSRIIVRSCNVHASRGLCLDAVVLDQFAYVKDETASSLWASLIPAVVTNAGRIIVTTTPNKEGSFYHRLWTTDYANMAKIELPYTQRTDRSVSYDMDDLRKQLGEDRFAQEYECRFAKEPPEYDLSHFGINVNG